MTDDEPVDQFDPSLMKYATMPWFAEAVDFITRASDLLVANGLDKVTVNGGVGRLTVGDAMAGALVQVESLPKTELAFVVMKLPDNDGLLDNSRAVKGLHEKVRAANPDASLLVLPADWSFRTMRPEMARSFASNMLAFVSDSELEKIGLCRKETL